MQVLDSFISPIPSFEGDIPIPTVPVSTRSPSDESAGDSMTGASAGSSRTQAEKRKTSATPPLRKKAKKVMGKQHGGMKINDPALKPSAAPTPPKGPQSKFTMHQSHK
jgi:hypothetical protein